MACRGVYYAITSEEAARLIELSGDDDALVNCLYGDVRESAGFRADVDKAWDAMHRCLGNGLLEDIGHGASLLSHFVLGGTNLYKGIDYIICYLPPEQVAEVAKASATISKQTMRDLYFKLDPRQYDGPWNEQDWEYTWAYFEDARALYQRAAKAGRSVVFVTDQ